MFVLKEQRQSTSNHFISHFTKWLATIGATMLISHAATADVRSTTPLAAIPVERSVIVDVPTAGELDPVARVSLTDSWFAIDLHTTIVSETSGYSTRFGTLKGMKFVITDIEYSSLGVKGYAESLDIILKDASTYSKSPMEVSVYHAFFDDGQRGMVRERMVSPIVIPENTNVSLSYRGAIQSIKLRGYLIEDGNGFGFKSSAQ